MSGLARLFGFDLWHSNTSTERAVKGIERALKRLTHEQDLGAGE